MTNPKTINIHKKYKPLFLEKTRYYVIIGGRGSGKSFVVSLYGTLKLKNKNERILFTRYTLSSADDSIIPEYNEKIELLNESENFNVTQYDIENKQSGSKILFRGIKTGSKVQTGKLKSLTDLTVWILDEADELTDEETFDKIDLSIRSQKSDNIIILVLNPSYRSHWIYKRFFEKAGVPELFNGIKNDVTYIHTTYLDNIKNLSESVIKKAEIAKIENKQKYNETYLGHWKDEPEGIVFNRNKLKRYTAAEKTQQGEFVGHIDVAMQGNDSLSFVVTEIIGSNIFIPEVVHSKQGESVTIPKIIEVCKKYSIPKVLVEANNQGYAFYKMLQNAAKENNCNTVFQAYTTTGNKNSRIIMQSDFILQNCYFLADSEFDLKSYYSAFLSELCKYNEDGKNDNDDAPDTLAGCVKYIRQKNLVK